MAIIPQKSLFGWENFNYLGDLERLKLVLENLPDEELMRTLERERGNGRDDYPIRAMWNSLIAGIVFQHESISSLRRELSRNGQLKILCGFHLMQDPTASAYSRFLAKLMEHEDAVLEIFNKLVETIAELLPDFGKDLALDGKAIETYANPLAKDADRTPDGRRDIDATWGKKEYKGKDKDGNEWSKIVSWFGYRVHLLADAKYELPVAFSLTNASTHEAPEGRKIIRQLNEEHPEILKRSEHLIADRGYDNEKMITMLWDEYGIKPIIRIRNMWQDGEETKLLPNHTNIVYDFEGRVSCYCPETNVKRDMAYGGFEKDRGTLKYRCPAVHYGIECKGRGSCSVSNSIRIKMDVDRRVFTPIARSSFKWDNLYKMRTSVERINSRLDTIYGFEEHYIRGQKKMNLMLTLAFSVMLSIACGRVRRDEEKKLRSLVKAA